VVLEGIDGSGKSEQLGRLAERLRAGGRDVLATHEPTDGEWGRRYRAFARGERQATPAEVLDWFVRDRREHVEAVIRPALAEGRLVLCARYVASTIAYQSADGVDFELLRTRMRDERFPEPDLVLWLRVPVEVALARLERAGRDGRERFERAAFLARVDAAYARQGLLEIDACAAPEAVTEALLVRISPLL
jgi:dTMP kinase